jgi:hypothetical protein
VLDFSAARNPRSSAVSKFILMMSGPMHPTKARKHLWYLFRFLLGLVLFYLLITSHERSTVLLCAVGVVLLHRIVTFSLPRLWCQVGMPTAAVYLSFMAGDGVDSLRKVEIILGSRVTPRPYHFQGFQLFKLWPPALRSRS